MFDTVTAATEPLLEEQVPVDVLVSFARSAAEELREPEWASAAFLAVNELVDPDPDAADRVLSLILAEASAEGNRQKLALAAVSFAEPSRSALLSGADVDPEITTEILIDQLVAVGAEQARLTSLQQRRLARLWELSRAEVVANGSSGADLVHRSLVAELAVACRVSDRTMAARLDEAVILVRDFPTTLGALEQGRISLAHARVIVDHGMAITDPLLRIGYERAVVERAAAVTPGRLRRVAQVTAVRLGESDFEQQHERAKKDRSVVLRELDRGMSEIIHTVPTVLAEAIWERLTAQAKQISRTGDPRSFDQIRADLVTEVLLTADPNGCPEAPHAAGVGIRADVSIVIPALTLLGKSSEPPTVLGKGPIDLATAVKLAAEAPALTRIITHPVTETVLSVDRYRPGEQLRSYLRFRDGRCRFPSCNRSPAHCDIDHTIDAARGGATAAGNLAHLCRRHHTLKHHPPDHQRPWRVRQREPGVLEWQSPHGRVVADYPDTPVRFE